MQFSPIWLLLAIDSAHSICVAWDKNRSEGPYLILITRRFNAGYKYDLDFVASDFCFQGMSLYATRQTKFARLYPDRGCRAQDTYRARSDEDKESPPFNGALLYGGKP